MLKESKDQLIQTCRNAINIFYTLCDYELEYMNEKGIGYYLEADLGRETIWYLKIDRESIILIDPHDAKWGDCENLIVFRLEHPTEDFMKLSLMVSGTKLEKGSIEKITIKEACFHNSVKDMVEDVINTSTIIACCDAVKTVRENQLRRKRIDQYYNEISKK